MERALWKRIPCVGANYLFLGDYVDRGQWGLECALYIMAFKCLCPNKVTMLRGTINCFSELVSIINLTINSSIGNHEVRNLQTCTFRCPLLSIDWYSFLHFSDYTYKRECVIKYGEEFGIKIWEVTNQIFDKLPVAATVDDAIYCAHGGIPRSVQTIAQINQMKKELPNPEVDSAVAWEILWSDPCHAQQFNDICNFKGINPKTTSGYIHNTRRGTAFLFNEVGANGFLQQNGLTHIVRYTALYIESIIDIIL